MTKQTTTPEQREWATCAVSFGYWCDHWAQVYDASARTWLRFQLWPAQLAVADALQGERLVVMLKARQLGMSWLTVAYGLWLMLFQPAATVLFFSKRDAEAVNLLSFRLRGIYGRLPPWMTAQAVLAENAHEFRLTNGSAALAFPTTGGRSYTGTLAVVDEADYCDLAPLLDAVKPTIDAGGQLVLLSTVDKASPGSAFKRIYQAAKAGENDYRPIFLPWTARPERDAAWYGACAATSWRAPGTWTRCMRNIRPRTWKLWRLWPPMLALLLSGWIGLMLPGWLASWGGLTWPVA